MDNEIVTIIAHCITGSPLLVFSSVTSCIIIRIFVLSRVSEITAWYINKPYNPGQIIPERRFVEAINRQPYQYEMGHFPTEWEAWIRKKRDDPPTIEEILKNENYRQEMKQKIKDASEKDKLLQAKEYKEGLVAEPVRTHVKGHASAPYYGKQEPSQDPTSTANTFQPGSWMPPGSGSSQNK
ncbi:PREDICTED: mimitin, mitochondrial [Pterocles gutturalis]|nr:PREDICTED: mimitin, mitochondrial [Pterocles gutturalis]